MEKFDPINIEFLINSDKVSKDATATKKSITGVVDSAEDAVSTANKRIANTFVQTEKHLQTQQKTLVSNKRKWDGLGNSINQLSREAPAFAVSAQTGFLALSNNIPMLADEIAKLRKENELLSASGQKGVPVWQQLMKSMFSWQTMLSLGVTLLTIYGKEIGNWIGGLLKGKKAIDQLKASKKALNDAFKSTDYQKAVEGLLTVRNYLDSAKKGYIDKTIAVKKYNEVLGETFGKVNDIATAEKNLNSKAGAYVEAMLYKTSASILMSEAAKEYAEFEAEKNKLIDKQDVEKSRQQGVVNKRDSYKFLTKNESIAYDGTISAIQEDIDEYQSKIDEVSKQQKDYLSSTEKNTSGLMAKIAALSKKFKLDMFGEGDETGKIKDSYKSLLQQIAELDKEYARKSLTKNEEEVQALKDKFSKIRALIEEFNADPKNQDKQIDTKQLSPIENKALGDLTYRQNTETIKKELDDKKKIYADFEEYKKQFGVEKAKEKYAEEIGEFDSYLAYIKNQILANQDSITAVGNGTATGGQKERTQLLLGTQDNEQAKQDEQFTQLLAGLQSYQAKRKQAIATYQQERKVLVAQGFTDEALELEKQHQENLDKLDEAYAKGTPEYKALILGVENLSTKAAQEVITNARKMVNALVQAGKLSEQAAADINKKINGLEGELDKGAAANTQKLLEGVQQIAGSFYELSDAVEYFDEDLAGTLETMGDLTNIAEDAGQSVMSFMSGDIIGGITGAVSAISGILSIGAKARESERVAREEIKKWQWEVFTAGIEYNSMLRERIAQEATLNDLYQSRVESIKEEMAVNKENTAQIIEDQQSIFSKLLGQSVVVDQYTKKAGGFLGIGRKTKVVEVKKTIAELLGAGEYVENQIYKGIGKARELVDVTVFEPKDIELTDELFEKLEKINGETPLTDDAKEAYDELVKLRDEYGSIEEAQRQLEIQLKDALTGTTAQSISDALTGAIADGSNSFYELGQDAENFLRQGIIAGLSSKFIEPEMQNLQDALAEFLEDGVLSEDEADSWKEMYQNVGEAVKEYQDIMNEAGIDLVGDANSGLSGAIQAQLTEETGSELTGLFRAYYELGKQRLVQGDLANSYHQKSYEILQYQLQHMATIELNTYNTVVELRNSVVELRQINKNTSDTYSR